MLPAPPPDVLKVKLPLPSLAIAMLDPAIKLQERKPPLPSATCNDPIEPEDSTTRIADIN